MTKDEAIEKLRAALKQVDDMSTGRLSAIARDALMATVTIEATTSEAQSQLGRMRSSFHINMLRAFPEKSHAEISAEIDKACGTAAPAISSRAAFDAWFTDAYVQQKVYGADEDVAWIGWQAAVGVEKPQQGNAIRPSAEPAGQLDATRKAPEWMYVDAFELASIQHIDYSGEKWIGFVAGVKAARAEASAPPVPRMGGNTSEESHKRQYSEFANCENAAQPAAAPAPTDAGIPISDERRTFEAWMINVAKCIVGSSDPYPAGMERDHWRTWRAAWQARGQQQAGDKGESNV